MAETTNIKTLNCIPRNMVGVMMINPGGGGEIPDGALMDSESYYIRDKEGYYIIESSSNV